MAEDQDTLDTSPIKEHAQGASQSVEPAPDSPDVGASAEAEPEIVVDQPAAGGADDTNALRKAASDSADDEEDGITDQLEDKIQQSLFVHEGKAAWLMLAYTATVWISHCILCILLCLHIFRVVLHLISWHLMD